MSHLKKLSRHYLYLHFFFLLILTYHTNSLKAQNLDIDLKVGIPINVGDTFLKHYDGVIVSELDVSYPIGLDYSVFLGIGYRRLVTDASVFYVNLYSPRAGIKKSFSVSELIAIIPGVHVGYSRFNFIFKPDVVDDYSLDGFSLGTGITTKLKIRKKLHVGLSIDYTATFMDSIEEDIDTPFYSEYHSVSPGLTISYQF